MLHYDSVINEDDNKNIAITINHLTDYFPNLYKIIHKKNGILLLLGLHTEFQTCTVHGGGLNVCVGTGHPKTFVS